MPARTSKPPRRIERKSSPFDRSSTSATAATRAASTRQSSPTIGNRSWPPPWLDWNDFLLERHRLDQAKAVVERQRSADRQRRVPTERVAADRDQPMRRRGDLRVLHRRDVDQRRHVRGREMQGRLERRRAVELGQRREAELVPQRIRALRERMRTIERPQRRGRVRASSRAEQRGAKSGRRHRPSTSRAAATMSASCTNTVFAAAPSGT
jgi:hypothetical protein